MNSQSFTISSAHAGQTLAAFLRGELSGQSWTQIRSLIATRRIRIDGELCLDSARRLREGQIVEFLPASVPPPRQHETLIIRHLDPHVVVVEKPSGISTVRHPTERGWTARRKALHPTLEDLVPPLIVAREGKRRKGVLPRLRVVQRLDKDTSGLVVFARTVVAESGLGKQFRKHSVLRRYLAVAPGVLESQRIVSQLVRDRGDGRRGSVRLPQLASALGAKEAITHVEVVERLSRHTVVACRLETGRTHQIRIHLAELGHPICGEKVYNRKPGEEATPDRSRAPRLALHATELGFVHPVTGELLQWQMELPKDLKEWIEKLRARGTP